MSIGSLQNLGTFELNTTILIPQNPFQNIISKMFIILLRPECVKADIRYYYTVSDKVMTSGATGFDVTHDQMIGSRDPFHKSLSTYIIQIL